MRFFRARTHSAATRHPKAHLSIEQLETRTVPYAVTGNAWPHPELVTLSFVADGTNLGGATSNLISAFNARFGSSNVWVTPILQAAQTWATKTNLNFQTVGDNGLPSGSGNYQQGDPGFGDIRISGFNFGSPTLAAAYLPPPGNNYSIAGDISFNTGADFHIGSTYDLYTVALHEFGHALGLDHSTVATAVMFPNYTGAATGLTNDDTAGIRNIYSNNNPRSYDSLNGQNTSFATAPDVSWLTDTNRGTITVSGRDITVQTQQSYYTFLVPSVTNGTMTVRVISNTLSYLCPYMTVYDGNGNALGSSGGPGVCMTTISVTVNGVSTGQRYYLRVTGADSSVFSVGAYAFTVQFSTTAPWGWVIPNTTTANGSPIQGSGSVPDSHDQEHNAEGSAETHSRHDPREQSSAEIASFLHHASVVGTLGVSASAVSGGHTSSSPVLAGALPAGAHLMTGQMSSLSSGAVSSDSGMADHDLVMSTPKRGCIQGKSAPYCNCQQAQPSQVRSSESESAKARFITPPPAAEEEDRAADEPALEPTRLPSIQDADVFFEQVGGPEQSPSAAFPFAALGPALLYWIRAERVNALGDAEEKKQAVRFWRRSAN